ncbi:cell growth defect protein [Wolffia australiana]
MDGEDRGKGFLWAIAAGLNAALAAVSAKLVLNQFLKFGLVLVLNVVMWACYISSLRVLSSLQATVTSFATNFLSSGFLGSLIFEEPVSPKWLGGAALIVVGVIILSKSSTETRARQD